VKQKKILFTPFFQTANYLLEKVGKTGTNAHRLKHASAGYDFTAKL
jgi:hypothetical protein